jgi:hypothetical protein
MPDFSKGLVPFRLEALLNLVMLGHLAAPRLTLTVRLAQCTSAVTMLWSFQYCRVWLFGFSGKVHLQLRGKGKKSGKKTVKNLLSIFSLDCVNFFFFFLYWGLNSGPSPWATLSVLFVMGIFKIGSRELFAWAVFKLWSSWSLSGSSVTRFTSVSHQCPGLGQIFCQSLSSFFSVYFRSLKWVLLVEACL